jgi:hypothetical protein
MWTVQAQTPSAASKGKALAEMAKKRRGRDKQGAEEESPLPARATPSTVEREITKPPNDENEHRAANIRGDIPIDGHREPTDQGPAQDAPSSASTPHNVRRYAIFMGYY